MPSVSPVGDKYHVTTASGGVYEATPRIDREIDAVSLKLFIDIVLNSLIDLEAGGSTIGRTTTFMMTTEEEECRFWIINSRSSRGSIVPFVEVGCRADGMEATTFSLNIGFRVS